MMTQQQQIIKKFKNLSDKHHQLSLLFYELSQSLKIETRKKESFKEFKKYLKTLNLDIDKIKAVSVTDISYEDLEK